LSAIQRLKGKIINSTIWQSIFRHGYADTHRNRSLQIVSNFFLHLHPVKIRPHALKLSYTWGMGGISVFLFIVLTITGVLLMFYYVPDVNRAYNDMKDLKYAVSFGILLRNLHRWAAHAMVLTVWLHMLSVFLRAGYRNPRQFNWCVGVVLLALTMFLSFTGYLLPWDQLAFWAVTVVTNMATNTPIIGAEGPFSIVDSGSDVRFALLGGRFVGQNALIRFYTLHVIAVPIIAMILMGVHFWRIRKDGFSDPP